MQGVTAAASPKRRWGRIAAILLGVFALLAAAAWAAVSLAFPPERLAGLLANQVKAATGRDFRIGGELSIRILPTIAVQAGDMVLGNAEWGSRPDMLRVRSASFELSPRAPLAGELRILRVEVRPVSTPSSRPRCRSCQLAVRANAWRARRRVRPRQRPRDESRARPRGRLRHPGDLPSRKQGEAADPGDRIAGPSGEGARDRIAMAFALGPQHWKAKGGSDASPSCWPERRGLALRPKLATATLTAAGTISTGQRAGAIAAEVSAKITAASALVPLGEAAAALPLPLDLRTTLRWSHAKLRAEPLHLALAGQAIDGLATLSDLQKRPHVDASWRPRRSTSPSYAARRRARPHRRPRPRARDRCSATRRCRSPPCRRSI